ncbi:CBS domain-containing protein [Candidatus Nitrospira neomarina]|uniref:CBS domain-containing protein n=1 Tax=Candidatus Nitrospira neomarina TaxID=3020899 RepID=A0AA96JWP1_9BACT|nr:CBS domain-containing protein [Candidatus Nitrospira neomarina]WNM62250.1 CBS domain-containing protein [Candidatus Nitrospira neomarina]
MGLHAVATVGLRTIQQVATLHDFRFHHDQNGLAITQELLTSSLPGAPVVDPNGHCVGFISQFDVLAVLEAGRDVSQLTAKEIMVRDPIAIPSSTTLAEAVKIMKDHHFLVLPVEENGVVIGCLTRQDLLRAWVGLGLEQKD